MSAFEQTTESYVERLVKEKGESWSDPEVIAKGKIESDKFIEDLKRQISEMREDLNKESKIEELLELARQQKATPHSSNVGAGGEESRESSSTSSTLTEEQLKALVESQLTQREKSMQTERNLKQVEDRLSEAYGSKAHEMVSKAAKDLNMSVEELRGVAANNPAAFFKMTGVDTKPHNQSTVFGGSRSSETESKKFSGERRNFAYYQDMRKKNRGQYYTAEVQHRMFLDAQEQGTAFYES